MATLYLIRHGKPEVTGVMLGQLDPPLSGDGRTCATAALSRIDVEVVWTSPLSRARETAELICSHSLVELPDLREIDQGDWTGKTWTEIEVNWPELAARKSSDWLGVAAPGGESWSGFLERVNRAWNTIRAGAMPAAITGHQGVNAALMYLIEGRDPLEFVQGYGEVIQVEFD
jgi:alpha-ribazole phosphatase